ncbi:NUC188 domain-containing protein [Halteromyces radiatus]|uniref:NUC188 domain-containing protein n=1 Tax=Halteromyces radiatus TaxID=101107 RepID=UPI0022205C15|nr:NUC188 domain-containing protein [Halteromyces radiatus]KAI8086552.1 NUC188 domain-containing protein [Halteromyces radiatus]
MGKKTKGKRPASEAFDTQESHLNTTEDIETPAKLQQPSTNKLDMNLTYTDMKVKSLDKFHKDLPKIGGTIDADQFMAARIQEVNQMQSSIKQTSAVLKVPGFEFIPRFLRRRAASHLTYHLRARDRARLSAKLASGKIIQRNFRKIKSAVLMEELISRKNKVKWLGTHKWHIKRMKMENWWGYRLAAHPMYKSRRITYRSFTKMALLHDASYFGCLQLFGSQEKIVQLLNKLTDPLLPSVGSARFTKGIRVGHTFCYEQGGYPNQLICPVTFLWQPILSTNDNATLWLWIHPSTFSTVQDQISKTATSMGLHDTQVRLQDLRHEFSRFELTGPRATTLLQAILDPVDESCPNAQVWRSLQHFRSGCCIPNGSVIGLTVQDPRLRFPQKPLPKSSMVSSESSFDTTDLSSNWSEVICRSDIWNETIRHECTSSKVPEHKLLKRREMALLPGAKLPFTKDDSKIPILLIQRNGPLFDRPSQVSVARVEHIEGWTLILPRAFALPFWRSLVFAGARTGGLYDIHNMHFDSGYSCFPYDYPTTKAFDDHQSVIGKTAKQKWERQPPAKRLNYSKLDIDSPFIIPFKQLLLPSASLTNDASNSKNDDYNQTYGHGALLQNDKLVAMIMNSRNIGKESVERQILDLMISSMTTRGMVTTAKQQQPLLLETMMVKTRVVSLHDGTLDSGARIYLVKDEMVYQDYVTNQKNIKSEKPINPLPEDLIGYVTTGRYSLLTGKGQGIGACSAFGLYQLQEIDSRQKRLKKRFVLVRNLTSREYKPAILYIT